MKINAFRFKHTFVPFQTTITKIHWEQMLVIWMFQPSQTSCKHVMLFASSSFQWREQMLLQGWNLYCCVNTSSHISSIKLLMLLVCLKSWCSVSWEVGKSWIYGRLCSSLGSKTSRVGKFVISLLHPMKITYFLNNHTIRNGWMEHFVNFYNMQIIPRATSR